MKNIDNKYIIDGLTIRKTKEGYDVFTIPAQRFHISHLDELTNDRFEHEIQKQEQYEKDSSEMIRLWMEENNEKI